MTTSLKRYALGWFKGPAMFEQPAGKYVKWDDVKVLADGLRREPLSMQSQFNALLGGIRHMEQAVGNTTTVEGDFESEPPSAPEARAPVAEGPTADAATGTGNTQGTEP